MRAACYFLRIVARKIAKNKPLKNQALRLSKERYKEFIVKMLLLSLLSVLFLGFLGCFLIVYLRGFAKKTTSRFFACKLLIVNDFFENELLRAIAKNSFYSFSRNKKGAFAPISSGIAPMVALAPPVCIPLARHVRLPPSA